MQEDSGQGRLLRRVHASAVCAMDSRGRIYLHEVARLMDLPWPSIRGALGTIAEKYGWSTGNDAGVYFQSLFRSEGEQNLTPEHVKAAAALEILAETATLFRAAAYALRQAHDYRRKDLFTRERAPGEPIETALDRWNAEYREHLIMASSGPGYYTARAVGEDHISKTCHIPKPEAVWMIKDAITVINASSRPGDTGSISTAPAIVAIGPKDDVPAGKFVVIDCRPQLPDIEPLINFEFRIPVLEPANNGTKQLAAELMQVA